MRVRVEPTSDMRRRVPSMQHDEALSAAEGDQVGSIRVVQSMRGEVSREESRGRSYRKAVPLVSEEGGEEDVEEVAVVRAGNILLEQVAMSTRQNSPLQRPYPAQLLPSSFVERRLSSFARQHDKARWSDQPSDDDQPSESAFTTSSPGEGKHNRHLSSSTLSPPPILPPISPYQSLLSSSSASSTLAGIGRSLQWSQKFPQGRHLSRAKSRTTLKSNDTHSIKSDTVSSKLAEARAGLRLLAKSREEVAEEEEGGEQSRTARWNIHKWVLFLSVLGVFVYGTLGLIYSLLTWAGAREGAEVSILVDADNIILLSLASTLCLVSSMVGLSGAILNSRPILALYAFLLWPSLLSMVTVGYMSYKRNNLRLDLKLNQTWSRYLDDLARLRLQELLHCCGYYSPLHQATFSRFCYPRTTLPGCKGSLYRFEKRSLAHIYTAVFSTVFLHLFAIAVSLLCSNHVNVTFGKGLTPRAYRLDVGHVRRNAVNIIRILSSSSSGSTNVHHLLQVDNEASHRFETEDNARVESH